MINLRFGGVQVTENPVRWLGTSSIDKNTEMASLDREMLYEVLSIDVTDNTLKIIDDDGDYVWVDAEDFEIVQ